MISLKGLKSELKGVTIMLPGSKSISNRAAILNKIAGGGLLSNLSDAEDTQLLVSAINQNKTSINCGHGGTTARFLMAFFAATENANIILYGSDRLNQRPMAQLIDALRGLGAEIICLEKDGFLPVRILGKRLNSNRIEINTEVSSQFVSSLLLISPLIESGLELALTGQTVSKPYILMTLKMVEKWGFKVSYDKNIIKVKKSNPNPIDFKIESDWSAAAFIYGMVSLTPGSSVIMPNLFQNSYQGDTKLVEIFKCIGVETTFLESGISIKHITVKPPTNLKFDFTETPDLAQVVMVVCGLLNIRLELIGLQTLYIKETNRVLAMQNELSKIGIELNEVGIGEVTVSRMKPLPLNKIQINTYNDHRMAMSLSLASIKGVALEIENPDVVKKSWSNFWDLFDVVNA